LATQLTVVIPTYNEAENLPKLFSALFSLPIPGLHILVVDDNSPDGTGKIADDLGRQNPGCISVIHRPGKLGLGTAYVSGFQQAVDAGTWAIAQMDADFSHPPEKLVELFAVLRDVEVALGSRYIPGGNVDERWPLWRKSLSSFGNIYARTILRLPIRDVTGGFRVWRREALQRIPLESIRSNGYAFQVEMAFLACRTRCTFRELPFYFADRRWGKSKMSFRIQLEAAIGVWRMLYQYKNITPPG
jgi:dolichol-phosphate mannosyltransferase